MKRKHFVKSTSNKKLCKLKSDRWFSLNHKHCIIYVSISHCNTLHTCSLLPSYSNKVSIYFHVHLNSYVATVSWLTYLDSSSLFMSFISVGIIFVAFGYELYGLGNCPRKSERMNFNSHLKTRKGVENKSEKKCLIKSISIRNLETN